MANDVIFRWLKSIEVRTRGIRAWNEFARTEHGIRGRTAVRGDGRKGKGRWLPRSERVDRSEQSRWPGVVVT